MTRLQKILFFGFLFVLAVLVYVEATKPLPVNWFPSYTQNDKIPLGTYVVHDLLEDRLGDLFDDVRIPPFVKLQDSMLEGTYIFINNNITFDEAELERLLEWVERGNTAFISANYHGYNLLDTLNLEMETEVLVDQIGSQPMVNLVNERLAGEKPYLLERDFSVRYFNEIDTLTNTVLGVGQVYEDTLLITKPLVNFIKAPWGKGSFYLHGQPEVFSNYFLLHKEHFRHTENVLAYVNKEVPLLWDAYYKSGKPINISPLHILFSNKYLKWAYYFILIGAALFVLFEGKRKQRSVPIVNPLPNKTYEYTRTIAGMYYHRKEHQTIARKQIAMFFEYIRTRLRVPTENINSHFFRSVAARSGNTIEDTKKLFTFIEKVNNQDTTHPDELIKLSREIATFKKNVHGKS